MKNPRMNIMTPFVFWLILIAKDEKLIYFFTNLTLNAHKMILQKNSTISDWVMFSCELVILQTPVLCQPVNRLITYERLGPHCHLRFYIKLHIRRDIITLIQKQGIETECLTYIQTLIRALKARCRAGIPYLHRNINGFNFRHYIDRTHT